MQDGAAAQLDAVNILERERNEVVIEHTAPAVQEAKELVPVVVDALPHSRINDSIQSGAIAAAGQQSNSHCEISSEKQFLVRSSWFTVFGTKCSARTLMTGVSALNSVSRRCQRESYYV